MTRVLILMSALALSACATPVTVLKNPQTGQTATCGGGIGGSLLGGVAGYTIEQTYDRKCAAEFVASGYEPVN